MSVVRKMNKTKNSSLLMKTLFIMIVVVVAANALLGSVTLKMAHAQQLSQPVLPPSAEVKPQPKTISPAEQTTQFKNILNECSAAVNAHTPDVNQLQSCDQKMSSIRVECDKSQMNHSICDDARLQDYIN